MSGRPILMIGAALGALAVMSGAFGAHALQGVLDARASGWYDTAATYHAQQALAVVACGILMLAVGTNRWLQFAGMALIIGIFVFSGSLYLMAFTGITKLGMITPIGGLALIIGWICLATGAYRLKPPAYESRRNTAPTITSEQHPRQ